MRQKKKDEKYSKEVLGLLKCNVCAMEFESKSKLFKHVNATGHALRV